MTSEYRKIIVKPATFGSRVFGEATEIVRVPRPTVPAGGVLVRVTSTGIEASDIIQMAGGYGPLASAPPVAVHDGTVQIGDLGCEGVGVVEEIGDGVTNYAVGDPVAFYGFGVSFRELVVLKANPSAADHQSLIKVPTPAPEWTALPVSALTAVGGLEIAAKIGERVKAGAKSILVTGAAGGTGHVAIQWAKVVHGLRVAGTCGSLAKVAMLKDLGADVVVNYREEADGGEAALRQEFPHGFDIIYEGVGGRVGVMARRLLAPHGVLVSIGSVANDYTGATAGDAAEAAPAPLPTQTMTGFFMPNGPRDPSWPQLVHSTVDAIATGRVRLILDAEGCAAHRGLEGVYHAQERMRSGKNVGKIFTVIQE